MRIDRKIKEIPWPEGYEGGQQDFRVTFCWPVIDHERLLVATFVRNRNKKTWNAVGKDFRLVCSKKQQTATVLFKGEKSGRRKTLQDALGGFGTGANYCYPEIASKDEAALAKWLGKKACETHNHMIPQLEEWVKEAINAEILRERDAKGELRDEDVFLCPEELPAGLVDYIRREVLPWDDVLIYKKGNVRGTCFLCGKQVKANPPQRFRQGERTHCPNCGKGVVAMLETGEHFRRDFVEDIATIQKGTDGKTLFVRQWHICRDMTAEWGDIPAQLEEIARYAVRGNRAAKWQREVKERWSMYTVERCKLKEWMRVSNVASTYDGQYFFFLPVDWREQLEGTSLQYLDIREYWRNAKQYGKDRTTIRLLMDWARYPMVEKLWKAGYTGLIHERLSGMYKETRNAIVWTRPTIQEAIRFPRRFLRIYPPAEWTMRRMQRVSRAWELVQEGVIREGELEELVKADFDIECIRAALGHASVRKIVSYVQKGIDAKKSEQKEEKHYYNYHRIETVITYRDYLNDCLKLGWDLDDRSILFPRDLDAAHARTIAQVKYKKNEIAEKQFTETREKKLWMEREHDGLLIRLPKNGAEIITEGKKLHHCVGGYVDRAAAGTTTILFIRRVEDPETPYFTLEWLNGHVQQCKGDRNRDYSMETQIHDFVLAWVRYIKRKRQKKQKESVA